MEELELLLNKIMHEKALTKEDIYNFISSYGYTELKQLSDERIDNIDKVFDYENSSFQIFTNTLDARTEFTTSSGNDKRKCRGNLYLSVKDASLEYVLDTLVRFLVDNNIYSKGYVSTFVQNDSIMVGFEKQSDVEQVIKFLRSGVFGTHLRKPTPFLPNYGGIGFVNYSGNNDYLSALSSYLFLIKESFGVNMPDHFSFELLVEILEKSANSKRIPDPIEINDIVENLKMINSKMSQKRK